MAELSPSVQITRCQHKALKQMLRSRQTARCLVWRILIVLLLAKGWGVSRISRHLHKARNTVGLWRSRWLEASALLQEAEEKKLSQGKLKRLLGQVLSDAERSGSPGKFRCEALTHIIAVACEPPSQSGRPVTHWTPTELADEVMQRGIVKSISERTVSRLLAQACLKPHQSRYWLNADPEDRDAFEEQVRTVCECYLQAPQLHAAGTHLVSTDEKTGIQALERKHATLPMQAGLVERREFEYIRHGTQCLIANFEVATGQVIASTVSATRTEADFVSHIANTVATDPDGTWLFLVDQLNTHQSLHFGRDDVSESLVCFVAQHCGIDTPLGEKGKSGVLQSMPSRKAFLEDASHRIRFIYTPKHTSWLNQVEIWFSILVRRLLKRASFRSTEELKERLLAFIEYFNRVLAKPFKWTYTGKPLAA